MAENKTGKQRRTARRGSKSASRGGGGVLAVQSTLELQLDWPSAQTPASGDVGTDLLILVREDRLFDVGLVVGAQVKTGSEGAFAYPTKGNDPAGWWYRDRSKKHTDYWLAHLLPHLMILHDETTGTSYWAHVTPDAVVDTGKGSKLLIPEANTLDTDHLEELMTVAGSGRKPISFEGSAWAGATPASSLDLVRFALLVPRLIAPHPNAGLPDDLSAPQAVALLMQGRFNEYDRQAQQLEEVPTRQQALTHCEWEWRFVGTLSKRIVAGEIEPTRHLIDDAPDVAAAAAATVVVASALTERGRPHEALEVLDAALAYDDAPPVDHAWLLLQRARALVEQGNIEDARTAAAEVQAVQVTAAHDVTATALAGVATTILFNTGDWADRNVAEVIVGADTTAAWWRTQTMSRGAVAVVERTFREWTEDQSVTVGASDQADVQLFVAALNAGYFGDQGSWRRLTSLRAKDALLRVGRHSDVEEVAGALQQLRAAGDHKALKLAIARVASNGPAEAVTRAAAELSLEDSTRTTVLADLAVVQVGGDLFEREHAEAAARWIVAALADPSRFTKLSTTHFGDVRAELIERLVGLMGVVPDLGIELVREQLGSVTDQQETLSTRAWKKLLRTIPDRAWTAADIEAVQQMEAVAADVRTAALGVGATRQAEAQQHLEDQVRAGSLAALSALASVADLNSQAVKALLDKLRGRLDNDRRDVRKGKLGFGPYDSAECVALLLSFHSHATATTALLRYLDDDRIPRAAKRKALIVLARNHNLLKGRLRERIVAIAERAETSTSPMDSPFDDPDISGPVGFLVATLGDDPDEAARHFFALLAGSPDHRAWAASIAAAQGGELGGVIPAMIEDPDPQVRQAAAGNLVHLAGESAETPVVAAALESAASDPGRVVPSALAEALAGSEQPLNAQLRQLAETLASHPSARVRDSATRALDG